MAARKTVHNRIAFLDDFRIRHGIHNLRGTFHEIANNDREKAVSLINDSNIQFPSLFALQPEIAKNDLYPHLNARNKFTLDLSYRLLNRSVGYPYKPQDDHYPHLKWMLASGFEMDGLNSHYDEVLDNVAVLLAKAYQDKSCLRAIEAMIFNRHRKGFYIYDLVWAFFECCGPSDLITMANRLRSSHPKDVELARQFFNFIPCIGSPDRDLSPDAQYKCAVSWLQGNIGNLYYTGETNQQKSNPIRFALRSQTAMRKEARHDKNRRK